MSENPSKYILEKDTSEEATEPQPEVKNDEPYVLQEDIDAFMNVREEVRKYQEACGCSCDLCLERRAGRKEPSATDTEKKFTLKVAPPTSNGPIEFITPEGSRAMEFKDAANYLGVSVEYLQHPPKGPLQELVSDGKFIGEYQASDGPRMEFFIYNDIVEQLKTKLSTDFEVKDTWKEATLPTEIAESLERAKAQGLLPESQNQEPEALEYPSATPEGHLQVSKLLSVPEIKKILNTAEASVRRYIRNGSLPSITVEGRRFSKQEDVELLRIQLERNKSMLKDPEFLTPYEVQDILKISEVTLYRRINRGEIHPTKCGKYTLFNKNEIQRILDLQKAPENSKYLSVAEAALKLKDLNFSQLKIRQWVSSGKIRHTRGGEIGKSILIPQSEVKRILEEYVLDKKGKPVRLWNAPVSLPAVESQAATEESCFSEKNSEHSTVSSVKNTQTLESVLSEFSKYCNKNLPPEAYELVSKAADNFSFAKKNESPLARIIYEELDFAVDEKDEKDLEALGMELQLLKKLKVQCASLAAKYDCKHLHQGIPSVLQRLKELEEAPKEDPGLTSLIGRLKSEIKSLLEHLQDAANENAELQGKLILAERKNS